MTINSSKPYAYNMKAKVYGLLILSIYFCIQSSTPLWGQTWRVCIRVKDGDTLVLDGDEIVRLIGIDAPELDAKDRDQKTIGILAYEFLKQMLEYKYVRLEFDSKKMDSLSRKLAYVFTKDGVFANEALVREGWAYVDTHPFKYREKLLASLQKAKAECKNLWSQNCPKKSRTELIVFTSETGKKYHRQNCKQLLSKIPISLSEACQRGYKPCKKCSPPSCDLLKK